LSISFVSDILYFWKENVSRLRVVVSYMSSKVVRCCATDDMLYVNNQTSCLINFCVFMSFKDSINVVIMVYSLLTLIYIYRWV
jgi:hypothetical protein